VPGTSRVLVLTSLVDPIAPLQVKAMEEAAQSLGVALQVHDIRSAADIPAAFDAALRQGAEGLIVTGETILMTYRARLSELAAQHRLRAMYPFVIQVRDGGLMGYVTVPSELQRLGGGYVDKILKGANPSDLPVEQPTKFHLPLNLKDRQGARAQVPAKLSRARR
jgi:putative tryptophan/tyrosine transport system substrate-binding protein